jgi:hypothetical protein
VSNLIATASHPDKVKKWLPCLGCGRVMLTDRCHRICKKCRRRNNASPTRQSFHAFLPAGVGVDESRGVLSVFDY